MGFSLNTSPAESDGGSPADSIEESFWQAHLWPIANPLNHQSLHPPSDIFGCGSRVDADCTGGEHTVVMVAELVKGEEEEEEKRTSAAAMNGGGGKGKKRGSEEDVIVASDHVNGERERRKKMRSMFTALQAFLPHLSHKVDKATVVDEAINVIKTLETSLQNLQHKADKLRGHPPQAATVTFEPLSSTTAKLKLAGQTSRESFLADHGTCPTSKPLAHSYKEEGGRVMFRTWTSSNVVLNTFGKNEALIMACSRKKPGVLTAIVAVLVKHRVEVEGLHAFSNGDQCSYMIHARLANGASEQRPNSNAEEVYKEAVGEMMLLVVDNGVKGEA